MTYVFKKATFFKTGVYINNSLHLARKYAQILVRGHYLSREANSFPRAKLEGNCEKTVSFEEIQCLRVTILIPDDQKPVQSGKTSRFPS